LLLFVAGIADAQRRAVPRHPPHSQRGAVVRGQVFIGGYFYDPFFGPYPWWPHLAYPYWYFPIYDHRADVHLRVEPEAATAAAVYVDGFYAGVVDDFNGVFQSLPLTPGGHTILLYLEGYRTVRQNIYLSPASSFNLRATMARLPAGETSERPDVAPAVPSATPRRTLEPRSGPPAAHTVGFGTVDLYVQPASAEMTIDGQPWVSSDEGHLMVQVPVGKHRVDVSEAGYRRFTTEIEVGDGQTLALNVSLMTAS
jgi:hypothetical protein